MAQQQRTALLVGAGVMAEGYLRAAEVLGLRVGVVETPERHAAIADRFPALADFEPVTADAALDESWTAPAMVLAARLRPDAVWGFAEPHVLATTMVQHRLGLAGPGLDAATVSRNKALQRSEFARAGLPQPAHRHVRKLSDATDWALDRLPVVVKPLAAQGSQGVERVASPSSWADAVARRDAEGPLLVEQYVEGPEYSVEALVHRGRVLFTNLTRKETTGPPYFVEVFHEAGHGAGRPVLRKTADELCRGVVRALGMATGIAHLEFRAVAEDEPMIMEVAVRTPGDHIAELVSRAHGFDVFEACLRLALGETPTVPDGHAPLRAAGSLFLSSPVSGRLAELDLSAWVGRPEVARHAPRLAAGAVVRPARDSGDRLAWAILDCATTDRLDDLARELVDTAGVHLAPGSQAGAGS
ncbi:ATP-grasp domain-containing protein [Streptomyces bohaiensis]|uniref:ATP-grasp domain-containing protein n=1 Tax=Streptomyces bohaiensis TaxID=1431344 RepID=UPI003B7E2520